MDSRGRIRLAATPGEIDRIFASIALEIIRAEGRHPGWPEDLIHGAAIVAEESGELVQAALQETYEGDHLTDVIREAVHTAATAVRLLIFLRRRISPPNEEGGAS